MNFKEHLRHKSTLVEKWLSVCLEDDLSPVFNGRTLPAGLKEAMYYSLMAGGKRIRPVLCLSCGMLFAQSANPEGAGKGAVTEEVLLPFAAAIECIHSYSLIHDDLPAMDDDDFRRGKPSSHKRFGEATAILAGDALLTDAFVFMASCGFQTTLDPVNVLAALSVMAAAAGSPGMVGGQFLDMEYTARKGIVLDELAEMQACKTGALLTASCLSGAMLAGAGKADCARIAEYGRQLGKAFQIVDDILDEIGDPIELGKPVGSDAEQGKVTYPSLLGLEESRRRAEEAGRLALAALDGSGPGQMPYIGEEADFLRALIDYLLKRGS